MNTRKYVFVYVMLSLFLFSIVAINAQVSNQNFKVINQSSTQMTVGFTLGDWSLESTKDAKGNECKTIKSNSSNSLYRRDETLPLFSTMIAIPMGWILCKAETPIVRTKNQFL